MTALDDYFWFEYTTDGRHEFIDGKIVAMAHNSEEHATIVHNLDAALGIYLRDKNCSVYPGDRMLFVHECQGVFYPDLMVVCGKKDFYAVSKSVKATLNPGVIIEIVSDSTEYLDKTTKARCYKKIASLQQIVFISQRKKHVRILERDGERWIDTEFYAAGGVPRIGDCAVPLEEIYRKVEFG